MDQSENPIVKTESQPETKAEAPVDSVVKPLVEEINVAAKSAVDNVTSSSLVTQIETNVEKLVSDPWATLKGLGSPQKDTSCNETGDAALPTSDKNAGQSSETARSLSDDKTVDDSEKTDKATQPLIGARQNASWMNCCGLLDVLKHSDE